jgi:hypothetical protein
MNRLDGVIFESTPCIGRDRLGSCSVVLYLLSPHLLQSSAMWLPVQTTAMLPTRMLEVIMSERSWGTSLDTTGNALHTFQPVRS